MNQTRSRSVDALLNYGHLKFFTLWPENGQRTPDMGDRRPHVILYSVQCYYAVHWTANDQAVYQLYSSDLSRQDQRRRTQGQEY